MVSSIYNRRAFCVSLLALYAMHGGTAKAETIVDLSWNDLLPENDGALPAELSGIISHDAVPMSRQQPQSSGVRTDWNGELVRLSGFVVPLDYEGKGVTVFMLVPYVGACIHVPPPPANQLVLVTTEYPYEIDGLFEAVTVVGMFGAASTSTQLADVGYALSADSIEHFRR